MSNRQIIELLTKISDQLDVNNHYLRLLCCQELKNASPFSREERAKLWEAAGELREDALRMEKRELID